MARRVALRKAALEDAPLIASWYSDPEVAKYMSYVVRCRTYTPESVEKELRESDPGYEQLFMVCLAESGEPIGHAGIDDLVMEDSRAEIFFLIGEKDGRGKGYGREIVEALVEYAFDEMGLNSLFATAAVDNPASVACMERAGFSRIGVRREFNNIGGRYIDEVFLDLTRSDYLASKGEERD